MGKRPAFRSLLFTADVETGVLRVLFNEAACWGLVRHLFLKLDTLKYLSSCSVVHRGHPLLFLFWLDSLHCSVKGVVHRVVRDLQFLGNFSHGLSPSFLRTRIGQSISEEFQKKCFCFWAFWACNRNHKCWCSRYSTSLKKDSYIVSLISKTIFSFANIIAKGFSNDQIA